VAWILCCKSCKFGGKIRYSNWDNEFFVRSCYLFIYAIYGITSRLLNDSATIIQLASLAHHIGQCHATQRKWTLIPYPVLQIDVYEIGYDNCVMFGWIFMYCVFTSNVSYFRDYRDVADNTKSAAGRKLLFCIKETCNIWWLV